jgi:hypothetical protein
MDGWSSSARAAARTSGSLLACRPLGHRTARGMPPGIRASAADTPVHPERGLLRHGVWAALAVPGVQSEFHAAHPYVPAPGEAELEEVPKYVPGDSHFLTCTQVVRPRSSHLGAAWLREGEPDFTSATADVDGAVRRCGRRCSRVERCAYGRGYLQDHRRHQPATTSARVTASRRDRGTSTAGQRAVVPRSLVES